MHALRKRRRRWFTVVPILIILLCVGGVAAWWFGHQPQPKVTAILRVHPTQPYIAWPPEADLCEARDAETFQDSQRELIKSPLVLEPTLASPEIAELRFVKETKDILRWLERHVAVSFSKSGELMEVSLPVRGHAEDITRLLNAIVHEYFKFKEATEAARRNLLIGLLEDERSDRIRRLASRRAELSRMAEAAAEQISWDGDLDLAEQLLKERVVANHRVLWEHERELVRLELILEEFRGLADASSKNDTADDADESSVRQAAIRDSIEELERRIATKKRLIASINKDIGTGWEQIKQARTVMQDLARKQHEIELAREVVDRLDRRIVRLRTENRAPCRVTYGRMAQVPK